MEKYSEVFKVEFQNLFAVNRLSLDLINYLKEFEAGNNNEFHVAVLNLDSSESEIIVLNENEIVTPISYKAIYRFETDFYYEVVVGLGIFVDDKVNQSLFFVEKCLARLKYNDDLSLYDIDFFIEELNRLKKVG